MPTPWSSCPGSSVYDERVRHGISVFQEGRARTIVLTNDGLRGRWSRRRQANLTSVERARDAVLDAGIPEQHLIVLKPRVHSTYDEALTVRRLRTRAPASGPSWSSPLPITRGGRCGCFDRCWNRAGVRVGIDSPLPGDQSPTPGAWWLSRVGWHSVALEYLKLLYYAIQVWLRAGSRRSAEHSRLTVCFIGGRLRFPEGPAASARPPPSGTFSAWCECARSGLTDPQHPVRMVHSALQALDLVEEIEELIDFPVSEQTAEHRPADCRRCGSRRKSACPCE